jgi:hypothetical protein
MSFTIYSRELSSAEMPSFLLWGLSFAKIFLHLGYRAECWSSGPFSVEAIWFSPTVTCIWVHAERFQLSPVNQGCFRSMTA